MSRLLRLLLACAPLTMPASAQEAEEPGPWRLDEAVGAPEWLSLEGHARLRYESFDEQFRASGSGSGQAWFWRAALRATARADWFRGTVEVMDARQFNAPDDLPLSTSQVNPIDFLQVNVGAELDNVWSDGDNLDLTLGRYTMDVGSRRFVARNRFRNTVNSFTGLNAIYENGQGAKLQAFYTIPVNKLPTDRDSIGDNKEALDEERSQVRFSGLYATREELFGPVTGELYIFGLQEEDGQNLNTRNRDLITIGMRFVKASEPDAFDFELELTTQTGESRASRSSTDNTDLDHQAEHAHLTIGYRWDADYSPRLEFLFDYASGDDDPNDGERNRFDSLFGVPHFEYGPTGIFRAFARENVISPALRLHLQPTPKTRMFLMNRLYWLASDKDAWTTSGLVDPNGDSGDFIGNLTEIRFRTTQNKNLRFDYGAAYLAAGEFIDDAPNATTQGDSLFAYVGANVSF